MWCQLAMGLFKVNICWLESRKKEKTNKKNKQTSACKKISICSQTFCRDASDGDELGKKNSHNQSAVSQTIQDKTSTSLNVID